MAVRRRKVENRRAIHVNTERGKIVGDQAVVERQAGNRLFRLCARFRAERTHGRVIRPVRRPQSPYPTAFLVYHDDRVVPADGRTKVFGQAPDLVRIGNVPREQDKTQRIGVPEKTAFPVGKNLPRAAEDDGGGRPRVSV